NQHIKAQNIYNTRVEIISICVKSHESKFLICENYVLMNDKIYEGDFFKYDNTNCYMNKNDTLILYIEFLKKDEIQSFFWKLRYRKIKTNDKFINNQIIWKSISLNANIYLLACDLNKKKLLPSEQEQAIPLNVDFRSLQKMKLLNDKILNLLQQRIGCVRNYASLSKVEWENCIKENSK
ncbi:MAG: hypothetical protein AB7G44_15640, partial [Bacteroidia bacterium]